MICLMGVDDDGLTPTQVQELERTSGSRRVPKYLSDRAAVVLDEHLARVSGGQRTLTVSRRTSARWYDRYRREGIAGLEDAARTGRPASMDASRTSTILAAPLYADSLRWSTRSVASASGTTQSAVARAWKRAYEAGATDLGDALPDHGLRLEAAGGDELGSALVLRTDGAARAVGSHAFMRSDVRPALQTILATDIAAASVPATEDLDHGASGARGALATSLPSTTAATTFVICSTVDLATLARDLDPSCVTVVVDRSRWQGMLATLGSRLDPATLDILTAAQHASMRWATYPDAGFAWVAPDAHEQASSAPRRPTSLATTDLVADAVVLALVDDISSGRLGRGDRATETHLAKMTHATRGQVRDALKVLASRGIIDIEPNRGAVIPTPTVEDVVETYAARRALGALLVRRAAEAAAHSTTERLEEALAAMLSTAESGDAIATGDDDFKLQAVIAEISGMRRVPAMFASLTAQLRLFVAVLRLRYGYSIPAMCQDDVELVTLIRDGDAAGAVQKWNSKMNDAATYMLQQLELRDRTRATHI